MTKTISCPFFCPDNVFFRTAVYFIALIVFVFFFSFLSPAHAYSLKTPQKVLNGEPFAVTVHPGPEYDRVRVAFNGQEQDFSLSPGEKYTFWLGAGLDKKGMQEIRFSFNGPGGEKSLTRKIEVMEKDYPTQHLKLPEEMVSFEKKTLNRIYKEKGVIRSALSLLTQKRYWSGEFVYPVKGKVLSEFGLRRFMNGKPRSPHRGVDFRAGEGTPIKACNTGEVVLTGNFFFGGNTVVVDHGQGVLSLYMHLSEISVSQGEMVDKGKVIGLAGSTGRATGPHLHFALSAWGSMVNPLTMLKSRD